MGAQSLQGDTSRFPVITLPDAGTLLEPVDDVIRAAAPPHMQQAAHDLGITSIHVKRTLRSGTRHGSH